MTTFAEVRFPRVTAKVVARLAITESEKVQGLNGSPSLANGEGMLFHFENLRTRKRPIAMAVDKMKFPIDFIFIRADPSDGVGRVVDLAKNAQPGAVAPIYGSSESNFVLEVPAGYISQEKVMIGDKVFIQLPEGMKL